MFTYKYKTIHTRAGMPSHWPCCHSSATRVWCWEYPLPRVQRDEIISNREMYVHASMFVWMWGCDKTFVPLLVIESRWAEREQGIGEVRNSQHLHSVQEHQFEGSEWLVMTEREVSFRGGGTWRVLVHALGARARVLLLRSGTGRHCRGGCGGWTCLLFKVRYDYCHVSHCNGQLLGCATVHILQFGSAEKKQRQKILFPPVGDIQESVSFNKGRKVYNKTLLNIHPSIFYTLWS